MRSVTAATAVVPASSDTVRPAPTALVVAAFAAVYLVWGSTYLAISIAIDSIPPLLMAGVRFTLAGSVLYAVMRMCGAARPTPQHWGSATVLGALLLLGGNGGVIWAQQTVPSGIAALVVAAVPLWMILIDWLRPQGRRPSPLVWLGLAMGFAGVLLLVLGRNQLGQRIVDPVAAGALIFATISWAFGSVYSRHASKPRSALLTVAMQMIAGGGLQFITGLLLGETRNFSWQRITPASAWAFVYLTLIGSLVGFTAYVWLLQVSTPARVSTYAYVNPLIAVALGHWILREPLPSSMLLAGAAILAAVILITRKSIKT